MRFLCYISPKSFRAFSSKFSVDSKDTFPPDFPARHPKSQSHLPFFKKKKVPISRATPWRPESPPRARSLFIQPGVRHAPGARTATTNPAEWRVCKERARATGGGGEETREGAGGEFMGGGGCSRPQQQWGVGSEAGPGLRVGLGVPLKRRPHRSRPTLSHFWPGNVEGVPAGSRSGRANWGRKRN